jgi:MFS transporter, DHA3 family, macrolide efflux protein
MTQQTAIPGATQQTAAPGWSVFITIWLGQVISILGSGLTGFALGVWVFQRTGSVTLFALIAAFATLPSILIAPLAGALVDRWDRRAVMIASSIGPAIGVLIIAWLFSTDQLAIWHIYLIVMAISVFGAFQQPAFVASTTLLVPKQHYGRASGMVQLGIGVARIIAPALAGLLVVSIPIWNIMLLDFASFLFAIVTLLLVRIPRPQPSEGGASAQGVLREDIFYGWRYISARPGLLGLLIFFAITNFTLGVVQVLITPLVLGFASPVVLGRVLSAAGAGMVIGGVVMSIWGGPKQRMYGIFGATLVQGLVLLLGGLQPSAVLVGVAAVVCLFSSIIINGCSQALWQSKVAPNVQGRVFAIRFMIAGSSLPLAYFVAGPLADNVFEPLLVVGGPLADTVGRLIGVGPGRGIGLLFIVLGVVVLLAVVAGSAYPRLRRVQSELPDVVQGDASGSRAGE